MKSSESGEVHSKTEILKLRKPIALENIIPSDKIKRLATEKHPTIEAIINGLFRFENIEQAVARLEAIKNNFILSSKLPKGDDEHTLKLWIRGYNVSPEEEKNGYLGNYAKIKINNIDGKFRLIAEKQDINLKYHPQRKRPKRKNPDWGHPALRIVRKGIIFEHIEEAQKILAQLHEEYPDVTIPNMNKLYIIIYSKALGMKPPIQKFILEIKASREGGFFIEYKANNYQKKEMPDKEIKSGSAEKAVSEIKQKVEEKKAVGKFTANAILKKSNKKAKNTQKNKKKTDDQ